MLDTDWFDLIDLFPCLTGVCCRYLFVVDVSYYAVYSGMVVSMIKAIREALQYLPGGESESRTKSFF